MQYYFFDAERFNRFLILITIYNGYQYQKTAKTNPNPIK